MTNPEYWATAAKVCTARQIEALKLYEKGLSHQTIALHLGISRERAGQLVKRAAQKIDLELRKKAA